MIHTQSKADIVSYVSVVEWPTKSKVCAPIQWVSVSTCFYFGLITLISVWINNLNLDTYTHIMSEKSRMEQRRNKKNKTKDYIKLVQFIEG